MPINAFKRIMNTAQGMISFQQNIWWMIDMSMQKAKRAANKSNTGVQIVIKKYMEREDLYYNIEWLTVFVIGTPAQEQDEERDAEKMYWQFKNILTKSELPKDASLSKMFQSKYLTTDQIEAAYKAGHGAVGDTNIANKILELGILTTIQRIDDYEHRIDINKFSTQSLHPKDPDVPLFQTQTINPEVNPNG